MIRNREILINTGLAAVIALAVYVLCLKVSELAAIIALIGCFCVYALCMVFTFRRYKKIEELANYLQKLSTGKPAMDIRENAEGELSILKNEIYHVTMSLTDQAEKLKKDKIELANALSDISHQLKTPLTSLWIMTDMLDNDTLPSEKRSEFIESIRTGQNRMEWLVLSLLKLAKLDADAISFKKQEIRLSLLVEKALATLLIPIEIKEQTLTVAGDDTSVICDPEWTAEAVGNIIKNASQNTPRCGHIQVTYGVNPLYSFIEVRDNGPGINRTDLPHLFKRFYRGKNADSDSAGIGLSMSLAIMKKQNGEIDATNDNGNCNGGVFTLKFYRKGD